MRLYDHPLSSYAQGVKIALREKELAFEAALPDDLGTGRRDTPFAAANPRGEVPTLLPSDPLARAFACETKEVCDMHYEAVNWGLARSSGFGGQPARLQIS